MVLLPAGSFGGEAWQAALHLADTDADALWIRILTEIVKKTGGGGAGAGLTHLAANEGIPASVARDEAERAQGRGDDDGGIDSTTTPGENILRSPTGLRVLYGDFGPASAEEAEERGEKAFESAFWVSTRQNGVFQTWAPRWTMFSRGNIKEKTRLLDFHKHGDLSKSSWAVDMYAGIGYFTFSYAKLGMRVLCWELNPWSVEGLRRGARGNGWTVRVVRGERELALPMEELVGGGERIVVFLEDNRHAARRVAELNGVLEIVHVNCGLLPTSDLSWKDAWEISRRSTGAEAWLHLHENVGVADIEKRKEEIDEYFVDLARQDGGGRTTRVEHIELVKTFAPGVWHCVFDLYITKSNTKT